jgi:hypothetical protein
MEPRKTCAGPEGRKPKCNGSHNEQGLEVKDTLSPSGRGVRQGRFSVLSRISILHQLHALPFTEKLAGGALVPL